MAANKAPGCPPGELRTLKLAGMMYAKAQDEADAEALADRLLGFTLKNSAITSSSSSST